MITRLHAEFPEVSIRRLCRLTGVSRSWYYAAGTPSTRDERDAGLVQVIETIVERHTGYGYRRVTKELHRRGSVVNHKRVLRLMRDKALLCQIRAMVTTTKRGKGFPRTPNLVRGLAITGPDQVWVADLTYIHVRRETVFLACILDAWSRRCIGWAVGVQITTDLTELALNRAIATRQPAPGLIHHSDQGMQYANHRYTARLDAIGARMSLSRSATPTDNALIESFFSTLKREEVWLNEYADLAEAEQGLQLYIDQIYNDERLHSSLGYRPPTEFEEQEAGFS